MEPNRWYGKSDMANLANLSKNNVAGMCTFSFGYLTKCTNPEWKPAAKGIPICNQDRSEPKYLYTLTPAGEARRRLLLLLDE